ncbi:MAG: site-2 protease family protein [Candidatus Omnitrophica bacterium]|nr:site-2 protease family protein [Candidatus Omnitrophota bacterium]
MNFLLFFVFFILSVTLHQYLHCFMAYRFGDVDIKFSGRLTINPLKHIDFFGTILLPLILILATKNVIFGYAKPLKINYYYFKKQKKQTLLLALIGPLGNLTISFFLILISYFFKSTLIFQILFTLAYANFLLAIINLIPIPPFDGSKFLTSLLPIKFLHFYRRFSFLGLYIVLFLLWTNFFDFLFNIFIKFL